MWHWRGVYLPLAWQTGSDRSWLRQYWRRKRCTASSPSPATACTIHGPTSTCPSRRTGCRPECKRPLERETSHESVDHVTKDSLHNRTNKPGTIIKKPSSCKGSSDSALTVLYLESFSQKKTLAVSSLPFPGGRWHVSSIIQSNTEPSLCYLELLGCLAFRTLFIWTTWACGEVDRPPSYWSRGDTPKLFQRTCGVKASSPTPPSANTREPRVNTWGGRERVRWIERVCADLEAVDRISSLNAL